jgi:hypothetical protein
MPSVFKKLQLKDQKEILVMNAPASFEPELAGLVGVTVHRQIGATKKIDFSLTFVTKQAEVDALAPKIAARAQGDAIVWFAYPKGTSKKYKCDFNRDTGWAALKAAGFDTVRAVSIDDDWTGLRFRRNEFIKSR